MAIKTVGVIGCGLMGREFASAAARWPHLTDAKTGRALDFVPRIVAVCDSFDAMTSDRPYRSALSAERACDEILRCAGTQFDPACAALLVDMVSKMGEGHLDERFVHYAS